MTSGQTFNFPDIVKYDTFPKLLAYNAEQPDVGTADDDAVDFEAGFGGNPPEESIEVVNPEAVPPDSASAAGSAADGSTITTGLLSLDFPAGTSVASGWTRIEVSMLPGGTGNCRAALEHCVDSQRGGSVTTGSINMGACTARRAALR